ncbi:MAG: universal stress protein, partial [Ferruginibacter sp.]
PIMGYESFIANNTAMLAEELNNEAGKFLKASAKHLGGTRITTQVLEGNAADAILECADKEKVDLLVLGSHSHSGIYKLLIGDVAEKVLKHTSIPLLIIPNKSAPEANENTE